MPHEIEASSTAMKVTGKTFTNSRTCDGVSFTAANAPLDLAVINISGRYPDKGYWARNQECHEMVFVENGQGSMTVRGKERVELTAGDVVHIPPGREFAWDGHLRLIMACNPPFDPDQYEVNAEGLI